MMVGEKFNMSPEIQSIIEDNSMSCIDRIEKLLNLNLIDNSVFPRSYISIIKKYNDEEDTIHMVLSKGISIRYIESQRDADTVNISRARGGIIAATINKIDKYENATHLIMPIKNADEECRFYYKSNYAHSLASR